MRTGFVSTAHRACTAFADQAVIAIENASRRSASEARDLQEFLGSRRLREILRVISSSPTDVQPVFDAIAQRRRVVRGGQWHRLSIGTASIHLVGSYSLSPQLASVQHSFPLPPIVAPPRTRDP
jgi:hypothetical protein